MEYLSSDKIAVIDLAAAEVSEDELPEELVQEKIGGAAIAKALYEEHADGDPIILGSGLLTGTMVPGSALGLVSAKSPLTGQLCHAPLTLYAGMELKYSGYDYMVIKGAAAEPTCLWIHDGITDFNPGGDYWGKDVWQAKDQLCSAMGDDLIQVLGAGPAAERGSDIAQVMMGYWSSGDRFGLGRVLAAKNLKLIAVRGMGLLEIAEPEEFMEKCLELLGQVKGGAWAGKQGLGELGQALGYEGFADWLKPAVHRHRAGFNTPYAYNSFAMIEGDPAQMTESQEPEPGVLLTDPAAAGSFRRLGLSVQDACRAVRACNKQGLDPVAVAAACEKAGASDLATVEAALAEVSGPVDDLAGPFSPWAPQGLAADQAAWQRRQAVAYIFGIDPIFALMAPELSEEVLLELAKLGTDMEFSAETLDKAVEFITS